MFEVIDKCGGGIIYHDTRYAVCHAWIMFQEQPNRYILRGAL